MARTLIAIKQLNSSNGEHHHVDSSLLVWGDSYHETLKKWVEVGNSGMFRPEMLQPMGLPADVSVIAWGLSLER